MEPITINSIDELKNFLAGSTKTEISYTAFRRGGMNGVTVLVKLFDLKGNLLSVKTQDCWLD